MAINKQVVLTLDFEFEVLWGRRYVWQVGGVVSTPDVSVEFQYNVGLAEGGPISQAEGLERLLKVISHYGVTAIRCHNVGAERSVLREWCGRHGKQMPSLGWIDTLMMSRKMLPKHWPMGLSDLLARFGLDQGGEAHTALPDARGCMLLNRKLWEIIEGLTPLPK